MNLLRTKRYSFAKNHFLANIVTCLAQKTHFLGYEINPQDRDAPKISEWQNCTFKLSELAFQCF